MLQNTIDQNKNKNFQSKNRLTSKRKYCIIQNMSLNCNEIDVALNELDLEGAFVQDVVQPGFDSLSLDVYKTAEPKTVFICIAAGSCRIHQTWRKVPKNT